MRFQLSLKGKEINILKEKPKVTYSVALVLAFLSLRMKINNWKICHLNERLLRLVGTKSINENLVNTRREIPYLRAPMYYFLFLFWQTPLSHPMRIPWLQHTTFTISSLCRHNEIPEVYHACSPIHSPMNASLYLVKHDQTG